MFFQIILALPTILLYFLYFIFFLYLFMFILRLLAPYILRYMMKRMKNKFEQNIMKEQKKRTKNYGDTVVEFDESEKDKKDKKDKNFGGEYVDFEELDEN